MPWARVACPAILFLLNAAIIAPLFSVEYLDHMYSVEGSFIAIARVTMEHPLERLWWPWWNLGMPFENSYLPFLPWLSAITAKTFGWSPAHAYHSVVAFVYCLGAATMYALALVITRSPGIAFSTALIHSLISPSALLIPTIRADAGSAFAAQRLRTLVFYGEGPHITALALWPLAILLFWLALEKRRWWMFLAAGASAAAIALTNAFGAVALAIGVACLAVAREKMRMDLPALFVTGVLSYLAIAPWLPPSLLKVVRDNADASTTHSVIPAVCLLAATPVVWALSRRLPPAMRFVIFNAVLMCAITMLASLFQIRVLSQGERYHLEMGMALSLLVPMSIGLLPLRVRRGVIAAGIVFAAIQTYRHTAMARQLIRPVDFSNTIEYRTAIAMHKIFGQERVMVTGSPALWFNVFTDGQQLYGGHEPFNPNWPNMVAAFTIFTGTNAGPKDAEICTLWLRAMGAHAINVSGPGSPEPYHVFRRNFALFDGLLPVAWHEGDDIIYRVPQRHGGLARVVPASALVKDRPVHGLDVTQIRRYVAALDDPSIPVAQFRWENAHRAVIRAAMQPGQILSVQTTFHPGWKAYIQDTSRPTYADGLGMLVIEPQCTGDCSFVMEFTGGTEAGILKALRALALLAVGGWMVSQARSR
jgi:hypothetical protein